MRLVHPRADLITVQIGHDAICNFPMTVELALSRGYDFLTDALPEFAPYAVLIDDTAMRYYNLRSQDINPLVMTYQNVPIATLAKFMHMYAEV